MNQLSAICILSARTEILQMNLKNFTLFTFVPNFCFVRICINCTVAVLKRDISSLERMQTCHVQTILNIIEFLIHVQIHWSQILASSCVQFQSFRHRMVAAVAAVVYHRWSSFSLYFQQTICTPNIIGIGQ